MKAFTKPKRELRFVDTEEFVRVWVTSGTLAEVCAKLGMTDKAASSKASSLRRKGVKLPRKSNKLDEVTKLNALIKRYSKGVE